MPGRRQCHKRTMDISNACGLQCYCVRFWNASCRTPPMAWRTDTWSRNANALSNNLTTPFSPVIMPQYVALIYEQLCQFCCPPVPDLVFMLLPVRGNSGLQYTTLSVSSSWSTACLHQCKHLLNAVCNVRQGLS